MNAQVKDIIETFQYTSKKILNLFNLKLKVSNYQLYMYT